MVAVRCLGGKLLVPSTQIGLRKIHYIITYFERRVEKQAYLSYIIQSASGLTFCPERTAHVHMLGWAGY